VKIAGMLRVKNEARWIGRVLESLKGVCDDVFVLDDHSSDKTGTIAAEHGAHVIYSSFNGIDETRDKNYLVACIKRAANPDWILHIDGDEELESIGKQQIMDAIRSGKHRAYTLQVLYLWDHPEQIRVDGIYAGFRRQSFFKVAGSNLQFLPTAHGPGTTANLHCTNVPADCLQDVGACAARLKHYGYIDRDMRMAKYAFYNRVDPNNELEDRYRHIVQGDFPEISEYAVLKWAGPLKLMRYEEGASVQAHGDGRNAGRELAEVTR
jgi:glycosyltransferase involved in cell wall biosynthesis